MVTDDFPCFFIPRMVAAAASQCPVLLEAVDSNGLLPLAATDRVFTTAHSFRRYLQKNLMDHLFAFPTADPLQGIDIPRLTSIPEAITQQWPPAGFPGSPGTASDLASLPIDHAVPPVTARGGFRSAEQALDRFLRSKLMAYAVSRNHPDEDATSGLSPYLHFGHISAHEIFDELMQHEQWSPDRVASKATGSRTGWWGVSEDAEAFLDQVVTWRELGYQSSARGQAYDRY